MSNNKAMAGKPRYQVITEKQQQFHQDGTPVTIEKERTFIDENGVERVETVQEPVFLNIEKLVEVEPEPAPMVMAMPTPLTTSDPVMKPNTFVFKQSAILINNILFHIEDGEIEVPFYQACNGAQTFDRSSGVYIDHMTYANPNYPDEDGNPTVAEDENEAIKRAFGGLIYNHDFRLGNVGKSDNFGFYASSNSSNWLVEVTTDGAKWNGELNQAVTFWVQLEVSENTDYVMECYFEEITKGSLSFIQYGEGANDGGVGSISTNGYHKFEWNSGDLTSDYNSSHAFSFYRQDSSNFDGRLKWVSIRKKTDSVVLSRQDAVMAESWLERVDNYGIVVPYGDSQYSKDTWQGVSLTKIADVVYSTDDQGVDIKIGAGYCKFGEWQTDESSVGYCAVWNDLTLAQKKLFLSEPKNHLYFDSEENALVQRRRRIRSIVGMESGWRLYRPETDFVFGINGSFSKTYPAVRGQKSDFKDYFKSHTTDTAVFYGRRTAGDKGEEAHCFSAGLSNIIYPSDDLAVGGKVDGYVLALAQRHNSGSYHPSLNPMGSAKMRLAGKGYYYWYDSESLSFGVNCTQDCFMLMGGDGSNADQSVFINKSSGAIDPTTASQGTGRPLVDLHQYYDGVYDGQIVDLRMSSEKITSSESQEKALADHLGGYARSTMRVPVLTKCTVKHSSHNAAVGFVQIINTNTTVTKNMIAQEVRSLPSNVSAWDGVNAVDSGFCSLNSDGQLYFYNDHLYAYLHADSYQDGDVIYVALWHETSKEKYNEMLWCDIFGSPTNIDSVFASLGATEIRGMWIGKSPDGNIQTFQLNRKAYFDELHWLYTHNNGDSWIYAKTNSISGFSFDKNARIESLPTEEVAFAYYTTRSKLTTLLDKNPIIEKATPKEVIVVSSADYRVGNLLAESLNNVVCCDTSIAHKGNRYPMQEHSVWQTGYIEHATPTTHHPLTLSKPTNHTSGVKFLTSLFESGGLYYLAFHGQGIEPCPKTWEWTSAATQDVKKGKIYRVSSEHNSELAGRFLSCFADGTNAQWAFYKIDSEDNLLLSDDQVSTALRLWEADSEASEETFWSNEKLKINQNGGEVEITDENGNKNYSFVHRSLMPIGIASR